MQLSLKLYLCICVFVYLYLGNERVVVGEWIVDIISFQKIFGLCGLKCHIVEIWRDVTFEDGQRRQRKCEYSARICEAGFAIERSMIEEYNGQHGEPRRSDSLFIIQYDICETFLLSL